MEDGFAVLTLPPTIGGGVAVSSLAYALVRDALARRDVSPPVAAERIGVDEADVLRALAELKRKGVLL